MFKTSGRNNQVMFFCYSGVSRVPTPITVSKTELLLLLLRKILVKHLSARSQEYTYLCEEQTLLQVGWFERPRGLKEVIQPHVPVRLPCDDLAPLADSQLDPAS